MNRSSIRPALRTFASVRLLAQEDGDHMKLELVVKSQGGKGKIAIEIGWKRRSGAKAADLRLEVGHRPIGSA